MFERLYYNNGDLLLVGGLLAILAILFAPIPPAFVDLAIIANFGLALTILLMTFYVARPVDFSTFPSLLLVVTLLRLAINVAATRLILTTADAGDVIRAVGSFAVGGNYIVGAVVLPPASMRNRILRDAGRIVWNVVAGMPISGRLKPEAPAGLRCNATFLKKNAPNAVRPAFRTWD